MTDLGLVEKLIKMLIKHVSTDSILENYIHKKTFYKRFINVIPSFFLKFHTEA